MMKTLGCLNKLYRILLPVALMLSGSAFAQFDNPLFETALDQEVWKYVGRSFGGDDVYVDAKRARRGGRNANIVFSPVMVNRMNCSDRAVAQTREEARGRCIKALGYASLIEGKAYWCGDDYRKNEVATFFTLRFDEYDGKGKVVSDSGERKDMKPLSINLIEPDTPSVQARAWLCRNIDGSQLGSTVSGKGQP
ncbi:hypothetical protein [Burkholderia sp. BCC0405]|uniref:hypothetical protein n=1 Tax=Burkholderia sp. BCC0405 TaxID=2676298 RepID=UPI00158EFB3A|nr:hypothetical protein [Burkholderia sp. BCC0405]